MHEQEQLPCIDPVDYIRGLKFKHPKNKGARMGAVELYGLPNVVEEFIEKGRPANIDEKEWEALCEKFLMEEANEQEKAAVEQAWVNFVNIRHIQLAA